MCIICRMREAGATEEVLEIGKELMEAFQTSMLIHQTVLNEQRGKYLKIEIEALHGMREEMAKGGEPEDLKEAIEKALGRKVEIAVVVELPTSNGSIDGLVATGKTVH